MRAITAQCAPVYVLTFVPTDGMHVVGARGNRTVVTIVYANDDAMHRQLARKIGECVHFVTIK